MERIGIAENTVQKKAEIEEKGDKEQMGQKRKLIER